MYPIIEYYQPTFLWLQDSKQAAINSALLDEPLAFRQKHFSKFVSGTQFTGSAGHQQLRNYLDSLEVQLAKQLRNHSVLYWLHMYRRIGPSLSPAHSSNTDQMTTRLVRDIVECAISKYGQLSDLGDIRPSSRVPENQILGGYFARRLKKLTHDRAVREQIVRELRASNQLVLRDFHARDFVAIYRAEGFAYEYWLTTARLRSIGKGETYTLTSDYDLRFSGEEVLNRLITNYDSRLTGGSLLPISIGTFVDLKHADSDELQILAPVYNAGGEKADELLADLKIAQANAVPILNFLPWGIPFDNYVQSHAYLAERFHAQRGYSLKSFLYVLAALSHRLFMPEGSLVRKLKGESNSLNLGILQALRRAYIIVKPESESIRNSALWYLDTVMHVGKHDRSQVESEIDIILSDLTLDSEQKRSRISPWSRGPRFMLIPTANTVVLDGEGLVSILQTLFFGLRDPEQERGTTFEESVRSEIEAAGCELVQRRFMLASGERETDAAVRVETTLWLVEAHSMWRPVNYEIGNLDTIEFRIQRFSRKLEQVASIRRELEANSIGSNYDVSWAQRIEHCVVSPFVEWIWTTDSALWIDKETPRILSVSELLRRLT